MGLPPQLEKILEETLHLLTNYEIILKISTWQFPVVSMSKLWVVKMLSGL